MSFRTRTIRSPYFRGIVALRGAEMHGLQPAQRLSDHADDLAFHLARVVARVLPLLFRHVVGDGQHLVDDGAAVRVAAVEEELLAAQPEPAARFPGDARAHAGGDAEQVQGDQDGAAAQRILEDEGFGVERKQRAL